MKVILDTNILIRIIVRDNKELYEEAIKITRNNYCFIPSVVLAETIFVLTSYYSYSRNEIHLLLKLLTTKNFDLEDNEVNICAIQLFYNTKLEYIDCWVLAKSKINKIPLKTFDKKLQKYLDTI